jgi:uncharacterized membrane protein (DUF4010 family)
MGLSYRELWLFVLCTLVAAGIIMWIIEHGVHTGDFPVPPPIVGLFYYILGLFCMYNRSLLHTLETSLSLLRHRFPAPIGAGKIMG